MLAVPKLLVVRRMIGVTAFAYVLVHLLLYALDESFNLFKVATEILVRYYLLIGFCALILLGVLAATSTTKAIRKLGGHALAERASADLCRRACWRWRIITCSRR